MSSDAYVWIWNHSKSEGTDRLVLLALAEHAHRDGTAAFPSVATLAAMTRVSERTVQRSLRSLLALGDIVVGAPALRHRPTEYHLCVGRGDILSPLEDLEVSSRAVGVTKTASRGDTAMAPEPMNQQIEPRTTGGAVTVTTTSGVIETVNGTPTLVHRSKLITDAYHQAEPMCDWSAVNKVVRKALQTGKYGDEEITDALLRLAGSAWPVTIGTLRRELAGPPMREPARSTTEDRMKAGLEVVRRMHNQPRELT